MMTGNIVVIVCVTYSYFFCGVYPQKKNSLMDHNLVLLPPEDNFPKFVPPVQNTTVTVGYNALLACIVDNLQTYKVAWVKASTQSILTMHQSVITKDGRISLSYNDHRSWYLHLRDVKEEDRGWYICQINTDPITSQAVYLQVLVPPRIIEDETSNDIVVRELSDVTLQCKATGYPDPYVMWRRADGNDFYYNGEKVNVVDGEMLHFKKISRLHMGTYYCVAQNSIPPPINKKISLTVHYKKKYEIIYKHDMYTTNMMMTIHKVNSDDYGTYTCVSINPLGNTDGIIKLYEVTTPLEYEWKFSLASDYNEFQIKDDFDNSVVQLNSTSTTSSLIHSLETSTFSLLCFTVLVHIMRRRILSR